jgi:hypothetical protein
MSRQYGDDVTSPDLAGSSPSRRAETSALRRAATIVLILGTVISLLSAFGPSWATLIGIPVAIVAAVVACILAWRELRLVRRAHARQLLQIDRQHGQELTEERQRNAEVVTVLTSRVQDYAGVIKGQKLTIAQLKGQLSTTQKDNFRLSAEIERRDHVIGSLRATVRAREAELRVLLADGENGAEVHALPRRVLADHNAGANGSATAVGEAQGGVVDLKVAEAKVLPNFEGTRKLA